MDTIEDAIGCLTVILTLIFIGGNVAFFSSIFTGSDLMDDEVSYIFALIAVVADIVIIGYLTNLFLNKRLDKKEQQKLTRDTKKVVELLTHYKPSDVFSISMPESLMIEKELLNKEVMITVKKYKERMADVINRCNDVDECINDILACTACKTMEEKIVYLNTKLKDLDDLKEKSDRLHREISQNKIQLLNEDGNKMLKLKEAFTSLLNSKKCTSNSIPINKFISAIKPIDLEIFEFDYEPVILFIGDFYFCLFGNVVLVFDLNGVFSSAIDPIALSIEINKDTEEFLVVDNEIVQGQELTDVDSKLIMQGDTNTGAYNNCLSNQLYNNNSTSGYRTDVYEYGEIKFCIAEQSVVFFVSSQVAIEKIELICDEYIHRYLNYHTFIPEFLALLKIVSAEEDLAIKSIFDIYKKFSKGDFYFCKEIMKVKF